MVKDQKDGLIAHLDGNTANDSENNLVWLCMRHYTEYNSPPGATVAYSKEEIEQYRSALYDYLARKDRDAECTFTNCN